MCIFWSVFALPKSIIAWYDCSLFSVDIFMKGKMLFKKSCIQLGHKKYVVLPVVLLLELLSLQVPHCFWYGTNRIRSRPKRRWESWERRSALSSAWMPKMRFPPLDACSSPPLFPCRLPSLPLLFRGCGFTVAAFTNQGEIVHFSGYLSGPGVTDDRFSLGGAGLNGSSNLMLIAQST